MQQPEEEHWAVSVPVDIVVYEVVSYLVGLVGAERLVELTGGVLALKGSATDLLSEVVPLWALARGVLALAVAGSHGAERV